jgi:ABC-2 type transport system ATP-binding protein
MDTSTPVIALEGFGVKLGKRWVLQELTAELKGRSIGLLGPNGAGKTTLINTLLGFHSVDAGSARMLGHDVAKERKQLSAQVGYMPERDAFVAGMTGIHFVRLMGELAGLPSQVALERAHEALFFVGLGEARYRAVDTYSQGMKQMAKLAQALVHGPRLLFLDEPTNGLDPGARQRMLDLVKSIRDRGETTIVLSSHLLKDVETVCDEVVVLKAGRIATVCDLEAERRANQSFLELELRGGNGHFAEAAAQLGCECLVHSKRRLKLLLPPQVQVQQLYAIAAEQGVQIRRLQARRDSLEDIFLKAMEERDGGS